MPWKIVKSPDSVDGSPYSGPACIKAYVPMGKIYAEKHKAETDAVRLLDASPDLFYVVECETDGSFPRRK